MTWKGIIGARFTPEGFDTYVKHLTFPNWRPSFVVVHNTSSPTLAQRPHGFTHQHILNLESFYRDTQHWSAGPHCFIDQNGIWVFTPLTTSGVHSPSWNHVSWGVETLGEYETETFSDPIHSNLVACLATMHSTMGMDSSTLKFHKEDLASTHRTCPGKHIVKETLIQDVHNLIVARHSGDHPETGSPV